MERDEECECVDHCPVHAYVERTELQRRHEEFAADRDEWRAQHERALVCWRADITVLAEKRDAALARVAELEGALCRARELVAEIHSGKGYTTQDIARANNGSSLGCWRDALAALDAALAKGGA